MIQVLKNSRTLDNFGALEDEKRSLEADGMITSFIKRGAMEDMCREVLSIGYSRYKRIFDNRSLLSTGGEKNLAVNSTMIQHPDYAKQ